MTDRHAIRLLTVVVVSAAALVIPLGPRAEASHRPNAYCSESGDICQSATKVDGIRKFRITLAARYFDRYRLCVVAPDGSRTCESFQIERQGDFFGDTVRWDQYFPMKGPGAYTVIWKNSGARVGSKLGFHR